MDWIKTTGRLVYDPDRGADFRKTHKYRTLVASWAWEERQELDLYYQWFLKKHYGTFHHLQRPMYGVHFTVVKGNESVPDMSAWKKHQGEVIEFEYGLVPQRRFQFWTLPVRSKRAEELRAELKIVKQVHFHMTVGRLYDWQIPAVEVKAWHEAPKVKAALVLWDATDGVYVMLFEDKMIAHSKKLGHLKWLLRMNTHKKVKALGIKALTVESFAPDELDRAAEYAV